MSFIRKHRFLSLILFLIPVLIVAFLYGGDRMNFVDVNTSDWITMLAGLFTYYGTVILAVVTVSQNDKLIEFQDRQEKREVLQDRREERQEERDKTNQEISIKQLDIAERQKEIADRQLQYVERQQEVAETTLQNENQPTFAITSLERYTIKAKENVELYRQVYIEGYDNEFKAWVDAEEGTETFYVNINNLSKTDAYDVSIVEVDYGFLADMRSEQIEDSNERQNEYFKDLYVKCFECIPAGEGKCIPFILSSDKEAFGIEFTISFRNAYNHWFYQDVSVYIGRNDNKINCQLLINDCRKGKHEVDESGFVIFKDGSHIVFPTESDAMQQEEN